MKSNLFVQISQTTERKEALEVDAIVDEELDEVLLVLEESEEE